LKGRKIEILQRHPRVCLEFDILDGMIESDQGCGWSMRFRSVLVSGTAVQLSDTEEKRRGLRVIMAQYSPGDYTFPDEILERTAVIRIDIESMTGRNRA
jgi:nitroimidazol reductase NimA-like FMN-containing flavoprotein (pyridoxamine 5'-phosphate oxidase superfamily)